jgi:hypothetical protein
MATFEAQLSAQIPQGQEEAILALFDEDRENGRASKADVIRAALQEGLPILARMSPASRLRLYAEIHRGE